MAAIAPQTLITVATCYDCYLPQYPLLKLALLRQILLALNPSAAVDPQTLINQANCYNCFSSQWPLMELALLNQIAQNGGGGGGGGSVQVLYYTGSSPTADGLVPTNQALAAIAYKQGGAGPTYGWNTNTLTWN